MKKSFVVRSLFAAAMPIAYVASSFAEPFEFPVAYATEYSIGYSCSAEHQTINGAVPLYRCATSTLTSELATDCNPGWKRLGNVDLSSGSSGLGALAFYGEVHFHFPKGKHAERVDSFKAWSFRFGVIDSNNALIGDVAVLGESKLVRSDTALIGSSFRLDPVFLSCSFSLIQNDTAKIRK